MNTTQQFSALIALIKEEMRTAQVPGLALGIYHKGETQMTGIGVTSIDNPLPVTAQTLFQIGSITKTFTGLLVMRLVEANKLDLDLPIKNYLPDFQLKDAATTEQVTMRHLLTHTGGWLGDNFQDCGNGDDALAKGVHLLRDAPQLFPLGTMWSYNNTGFYIAGLVIEQICQQTFEAALLSWVLKPLGMQQAFFFLQDICTRQFAVGHYKTSQGKVEVMHQYGCGRMANPAGGLVTNVEELLRYAQFFLNQGVTLDNKRLLTAANLECMHQPQLKITQGVDAQSMGLSWLIREINGVKIVSHGGGVPGQCAFLALVPEHDFAFTFLLNSSTPEGLLERLCELIYKEYLNLDTNIKATIVSGADLKKYVGTYTDPLQEVICSVEYKEERLSLQMQLGHKIAEQLKIPEDHPKPSKIHIGFIDFHNWISIDQEADGVSVRGEFIADSEGQIKWLRMGRLLKKQHTAVDITS